MDVTGLVEVVALTRYIQTTLAVAKLLLVEVEVHSPNSHSSTSIQKLNIEKLPKLLLDL